MFRIQIRDPVPFWPWIRERKNRIRDKHPGSGTLPSTPALLPFLFPWWMNWPAQYPSRICVAELLYVTAWSGAWNICKNLSYCNLPLDASQAPAKTKPKSWKYFCSGFKKKVAIKILNLLQCFGSLLIESGSGSGSSLLLITDPDQDLLSQL